MPAHLPTDLPPGSRIPPEQLLRLLERNIRDYAIFTLDPGGHVTSWNVGAERIKGYTAEEIAGRHFSVFYPAQDIESGKPERELATAAADGRVEDEGWRLRKDGSRFWANVVITALYDDAGTLHGFGKITRDMTERRDTEQALRESEEHFRLLVQGVTDYAIFMLDPGGHIVSWNAGAERIKGYTAGEIAGRHFSVFYPPEDLAAGKPAAELRTAIADGRVEDEGWRLRKDGSRFWANVVITALYDDAGRLRGFGKVTRDMTERRDAEQNLNERRRLLSHMVQAQETERRRIAWDVHDDPLQAMVAVGMRQQLLAARLPEPHAAQLNRLTGAVNDAIARLRSLVSRLRPPGIEHDGLVGAVTDHLAETAGPWGLAYRFDHRLTAEPSPEAAVTIFRISQEALTNVHKHAHAKAVTVTLTESDRGLLTTIADDGVGIREPADLAPGPDHFGVIEMRERAETAGGWWTMHRADPHGTVVEFWIPSRPPAFPEADT
jgi:PAS domain S-box-containing protein